MNSSLLERVDKLTDAFKIIVGFNQENEKNCTTIREFTIRLKSELNETNKILEEKLSSIEKMTNLSKRCDYLNEYLNFVQEHMPDENLSENVQESQYSIEENVSLMPTITVTHNAPQQHVSLVPNRNGTNSISRNVMSETFNGNGVAIVKLRHISVNELNSVHKYMKGRLTVDDINGFIDIFNTVVTKKYEILKAPKNRLHPKEQSLFRKWKVIQKEAALPPGSYFCTANDFMEIGKHKITKSCFAKLVVIRHLKLITESRCRNEQLYIINSS